MKYRTKVTVLTGDKKYNPGAVLPENISPFDLAFLKKKGFVTPIVEDEQVQAAAAPDDDSEDEGGLFDEVDPGNLKTDDEIRKMKKKDEVKAYADAIGLDLGEDFKDKTLNELYDAVINYQEAVEDGLEPEE